MEEFLLQLSAAWASTLKIWPDLSQAAHMPQLWPCMQDEVLTLLSMKTLSSRIRKHGLTVGTCYQHVLP